MNSTSPITTDAYENSKANATAEISKVSVAFIAITAGVIGLWATASLFAGTMNSGGPIELFQNLIITIVG